MKNSPPALLLVVLATTLAATASPDADRRIEDTARASYNYRQVLEDHVRVKSDDGVVTLTGTVQDEADLALAADTVASLPGVLVVRNEIAIEAAYPEHSDAWVALKVRSLLLVRARVSVATTRVSAHDGVVTLTGTADNPAQKDLTAVYAGEIDGVKSVVNDITLNESPSMSASIGDSIDDASITGQVKHALNSDKSTRALDTKVTTRDAVVVITGDAPSAAEKSLVTKLAEDVRGAKSVTNDMVVKS